MTAMLDRLAEPGEGDEIEKDELVATLEGVKVALAKADVPVREKLQKAALVCENELVARSNPREPARWAHLHRHRLAA
jgi:hypothetical protein